MAYFGDSKSAVPANYGQQAVASSSTVAKRRALQKYFEEQEAAEDAKMTATAPLSSTKRYQKEDIGPKSIKKLKSNAGLPVPQLPGGLAFESDLRPQWMRNIPRGPMKTVFDAPDLNQYIMQGVETPFCAEATNRGERCARAFVYRNREPEQKGTRFAAPQQLNCTQYCGVRCLEWLTKALESPPREVYVWSADGGLLGTSKIPLWELTLQESKRDYDNSVYKAKMDGKSVQWVRTKEPFATSLSFDEDVAIENGTKMSVPELAAGICAKLSEEGTSLRLTMERISVRYGRPQPSQTSGKFRDPLQSATISFAPRGAPNATWIRPNATWEYEQYNSFFTSLRSWYTPPPSVIVAAPLAPAASAARNAKAGGSSPALMKAPAHPPALINRLF